MRFLVRFTGLIVLALGFIGIVIDGTRSMANATVWFTSLNEASNAAFPNALENLHAGIVANAPSWLWDQVCVTLLQLPASVVCFAFGALLIKLSDKKRGASALDGMAPRH